MAAPQHGSPEASKGDVSAIRPLRSVSPGIHTIPAADYHSGPGVSKSNLDLVHVSPALLEWSRAAPVDDEAKTAVDLGSAFHCLLLEPERFDAEYVADFSPPSGALVTVEDIKGALTTRGIAHKSNASKAALTKLLLDSDPDAPVTDALHAEWRAGVNGRIVLSPAEMRKLQLMRDSVMAHPFARKLLEARGDVERCHYWEDARTGELCRARMDKTIPALGMILDLKTTADLPRFSNSIREYRYHVQDTFYSDGYEATLGELPRAFVFLVVSTTRDRYRYPVRLFSLTQIDRSIGRAEYRADLDIYAQCRKSGVWPGIESISLPDWYLAKAAA